MKDQNADFRGTVCFNHGKESGSWGSKITKLADIARGRGFAVESINLHSRPIAVE